MGVARKWHFSTSGGAANLGGVSGDLFEHRGSGIPLLGVTSLFMHKLTGLNTNTVIALEIREIQNVCKIDIAPYSKPRRFTHMVSVQLQPVRSRNKNLKWELKHGEYILIIGLVFTKQPSLQS